MSLSIGCLSLYISLSIYFSLYLTLSLSLLHYLYLSLSLIFLFLYLSYYPSICHSILRMYSILLFIILFSGCTPYPATFRLYSMIHPVPLSHSVSLSFCVSPNLSLSHSLCIFLSLTLSLSYSSLSHSFSPSLSFLSLCPLSFDH